MDRLNLKGRIEDLGSYGAAAALQLEHGQKGALPISRYEPQNPSNWRITPDSLGVLAGTAEDRDCQKLTVPSEDPRVASGRQRPLLSVYVLASVRASDISLSMQAIWNRATYCDSVISSART